jgi:regulatory protein
MKEKKTLTTEETREKALKYLEYRAHSEKELSDKLRRAGARAEDIESALEFVQRYNFVNDADYARRLARDLKKLKKYGSYRIRQELKFKGISEEYISEAMAQFEEEDETDALLPLVEKRLRGNFEQKNIDRVIRYFAYRGYRFEDIKRCVDIAKDEGEI